MRGRHNDREDARQVESRTFNPSYKFTSKIEDISVGEVAAPLITFGNIETGTANKELVVYYLSK